MATQRSSSSFEKPRSASSARASSPIGSVNASRSSGVSLPRDLDFAATARARSTEDRSCSSKRALASESLA
jgi:hypothetical protein